MLLHNACFFLPVCFDVPWTKAFLKFIAWFQIVTTDILFLMMGLSCKLRADFFSYFTMKMMVIPVGLTVAFLADRGARLAAAVCCRKKNGGRGKIKFLDIFQIELSDLFYETLDFVIYMSYAQVCSSLFMYFRCRTIQGQSYLVQDMRISCDHGTWIRTLFWAYFFVGVYMVGIPATQLYCLYKERHYLHGRNDNPKRHDNAVRKFGSLVSVHIRWCCLVLV